MATHSSIVAWRIPRTGAWWAAVHRVAQSWTRLKWLSGSSMYTMVTIVTNTILHTCVKWIISCHICGQKMAQLSGISGLLMWMRAPQGEHNSCNPADAENLRSQVRGCKKQPSATLATPYRDRKQDLAPDSWGAHERNEFSEPREPRGLHLPIHRIMLTSLAWYLGFLVCKLIHLMSGSLWTFGL